MSPRLPRGVGQNRMISDEILMLQFQAGSRAPLEELFARYGNLLEAFFYRRLGSKQVAEDLAQETWIAIIRGAQRYEPRALFRTYLYGIALKQVAGMRRKSMRQEAVSGVDARAAAPERAESERWVREALEKLNATDREIIMLREYEQLTYLEIAGLLNLPTNTVRSRLFRARITLRQLLQPNSDEVAAERRQ